MDWTVQRLNSDNNKSFLFSKAIQTGRGAQPPLLFVFPAARRPGREFDNLPATNVKIKNEWSNISMERTGTTFKHRYL
jgi:hypothetical protein